ncbi:hypothetical protein GRAN_4140 [Granulicella sibirica]|uniref:DUF4174 domain-containing protein n=2 Tax=Granulicella sibirica TaxID=2479048 RepID=A0A4Q0T0W2_9BACT|nr:hypothetical protein GRAN_4140 [Granulicella sibirica]
MHPYRSHARLNHIFQASKIGSCFSMMTPAIAPRPLVLAQARHQLRPLLVFAPGADDPRLRAQCALLTDAPLAVRDVVVALLPQHGETEPCSGFDPSRSAAMPPAEATDARKRFHIGPDAFTVILIGKDGGEKLRSSDPIPAQKLLDTIDAMPMRQQEARRYGAEQKVR